MLLLSLRRRKKGRKHRSHTFKKIKCDFFSQDYNNLTSTSWPPRKLMFARHTHHNGVCTSHIHQSVTKCEIPSFIYIRESVSYRVLVIASFWKNMLLCSWRWKYLGCKFLNFLYKPQSIYGERYIIFSKFITCSVISQQ